MKRPRLLNKDAFGAAWMLVVRAQTDTWREGLVTGAAVEDAFTRWLAAETYKDRADG